MSGEDSVGEWRRSQYFEKGLFLSEERQEKGGKGWGGIAKAG